MLLVLYSYMMFVSLLIFFMTCYLYWKWYTRRLLNEPPMLPGAWPFIGHAHLLLGDTKSFWQLVKNLVPECMGMGNVLYFLIGHVKMYALTDPDDIHQLLSICFEKDQYGYAFTENLLGNGLLFAYPSTWKKHRKLINPTFNQQILNGFLGIMNNQGRKLVNQLQAEIGKGYFYSTDYIQLHSMETLCLTTLEDSVAEDQALKYVKLVELYLHLSMTRIQCFWLHSNIIYQYSGLKKKLDKCIGMLNEMSDSILRKKRNLRKHDEVKSNNQTGSKVKVFMDLLMDLDDGSLSEKEIRDELNTIMITGQETIATAMEFILILIGSYPEVQEKIYIELQEVLQDRDVKKHDLSRLVYLEAVIKESLRYYVIVPFISRYIDREVQLKNSTLKPGYNSIIFLYGIHRNSQWGSDVDDFKPERWLDPTTTPKNSNLFAMFGLGKRNCIGKYYAMMSLKTSLSYVLRRYKIHADHTKVVLKVDFVLKPVNGHMISIEDRSKI